LIPKSRPAPSRDLVDIWRRMVMWPQSMDTPLALIGAAAHESGFGCAARSRPISRSNS
jgi:hypothetical protein